MTTYSELRLRIDRGVTRGSYRIVATGPAGEALGRFKLPFSDIELENFILKVGSTRRGRRRIDSPEMELAKDFGTKLFGALFEGDVRELYRSSFAETRSDGRGLRVTLSLTGAPELLQVPWEYLYDHPSFLSISTWTPIVRYLDLPKPRRPLQVELPLRILALVSAPSDFEMIDAQQERTKLEGALAPLIGVGAIAIDWLEEASLRALQRQLRRADYHVFHYIGHGGYDQDADDGILMFEDELGRGRRVSGVQLGTILADEVSLRLAVLNSCEGGRSSLQDPFSGVATSLIEREIPAVIGMQFEITDRAAIVFATEFYAALADGLAVDSSVAEARKAIYADQNDIEWATPVLFMRVADGRLFDVKVHTPVRPQPDSGSDLDELRVAVEDVARQEVEEREAAERAADASMEAAKREQAAAAAEAETERARQAAETERVAAATEAAEHERVAEAAAASSPSLVRELPMPAIADGSDAGVAATTTLGGSDSTVAPQPAVADAVAEGIPPGLGRTARRAAVGGLLGLAMIWLSAPITQNDLFGSNTVDFLVWLFLKEAFWTVIAMVAAVTAAESVLPAVRVPGGSAYQRVSRSRWTATAIQGAVAGGTVGFVATNLLYILDRGDDGQLDFAVAVQHAVFTALGFLIAEAAFDRLARRRDTPTRT